MAMSIRKWLGLGDRDKDGTGSTGKATAPKSTTKEQTHLKFQERWLASFSWLRYDNEVKTMFCEPCRETNLPSHSKKTTTKKTGEKECLCGGHHQLPAQYPHKARKEKRPQIGLKHCQTAAGYGYSGRQGKRNLRDGPVCSDGCSPASRHKRPCRCPVLYSCPRAGVFDSQWMDGNKCVGREGGSMNKESSRTNKKNLKNLLTKFNVTFEIIFIVIY